MDSMDWFPLASRDAHIQIRNLNRALRPQGRVLLRSAGLKPWYAAEFEILGFSARRVAARLPGTCIDRCVQAQTPPLQFLSLFHPFF